MLSPAAGDVSSEERRDALVDLAAVPAEQDEVGGTGYFHQFRAGHMLGKAARLPNGDLSIRHAVDDQPRAVISSPMTACNSRGITWPGALPLSRWKATPGRLAGGRAGQAYGPGRFGAASPPPSPTATARRRPGSSARPTGAGQPTRG